MALNRPLGLVCSALLLALMCQPAAAVTGQVQFSAEAQQAAENIGEVVVTVTRSGGAVGPASVRYATADASARAGSDYLPASGVLLWRDGQAGPMSFSVRLLDDAAIESPESFKVQLDPATATGARLGYPRTHYVTVKDDDAANTPGSMQFASASVQAREGQPEVEIKLTRSGGSRGAATVRYSTADASAKAGSDYLTATGVVAWADGDAEDKFITVKLLDNSTREYSESFKVQLDPSTETGAKLGYPQTLYVAVADDDVDSDGDGTADAGDNCPLTANPSQIDVDADGIGDACEPPANVGCPAPGTVVVANWTGYLEPGATVSGTGEFPEPIGMPPVGGEPTVLAEQDVDIAGFTLPANCGIESALVEISWTNPVEDLDLFVVGQEGQDGADSATINDPEVATLFDPAGAYEAHVVGFTNIGTEYRGKITVVTAEIGIGPQCGDGLDNDDDGKFDFPNDRGCTSADDDSEAGEAPTACDVAYANVPTDNPSIAPAIPVGSAGGLILSFADDTGRDTAMRVLSAGRLLNAQEVFSLHRYQNLPIIYFKASLITQTLLADLKRALAPSRLISIWDDRGIPFNLDTSTAYIEAPQARQLLDVTGKGVGVAIIDSGIDTTQGDFENVRDNRKFIGPVGVASPYGDTTSGHGTHVAGIVGGTGASSGGRWKGVAPEATLLGYGGGDADQILIASALAGYDRMLTVKDEYNVRVTNNSFGGPGDFDPTNPLMVAVKRAYDHGIISVFATGNSGPDSLSSYAGPCTISVANGDRDGQLATDSSRAAPGATRVPTVTAPGSDITAPRAMTGVLTLPNLDNPRYSTISGTSMASPHVAGVIALMLEDNPNLLLEDVVDIFEATSRPMTKPDGTPYPNNEVGFGYVDALAAVAAAKGVDEPDIPPPPTGNFCEVPGKFLAIDPEGDDNPPLPTADNGSGDLLWLRVSEPANQFGKLIFQMKLRSLQALPPNVQWTVIFNGPAKGTNTTGKWHVEMETNETSVPTFSYGRYNPANQNLAESPNTADGDQTAAEAMAGSSYDPSSGIITLVLNRGNFGMTGQTLANVNAVVYQVVGALGAGSLQIVDATTSSSYTLRTATACDPPNPDLDGDGVLNGADNCPLVANADQANQDGDAKGDVCDPDRDGDGVANELDAFPNDPTESRDTDGDGAGNNLDTDDDDDGFADGADNCPLHDNPGQEDADGDGIGDACDNAGGGCPLANGNHVVHEWDGAATPAVVIPLLADAEEPFSLPASCTYSSLTVEVTAGSPVEDLDIDLTKPDNTVQTSAQGGNTETLTLANPAAGSYKAKVYGFLSSGLTSFQGKVTVNVTGSGGGGGTDTDGDGVLDGADNCATVANASQLNNDGDALGDACDTDDDNDSVADAADNCPFNANPDQADANDNDVGDACELAEAPRVVVADIDSGINVFHKFYYEGSPIYPAGSGPSSVTTAVLAEFDIADKPQCQVDVADYSGANIDARRLALSNDLKSKASCPVFWFKRTNILAKPINVTANTLWVLPNDETDTHGVGTSAAVLTANPEAILLFLESGANVAENAEVENYAFTHDAVDIVTTSYGYGPVVGLPVTLSSSHDGVVKNGKIHVGSCDNAPTPAPVTSGTCGPWWVFGVAGYEETQANEPAPASNGRQSGSGMYPDFIGDYTQTLPYCASCDDGYQDGVGGTSFATPRSAGTISRIILEARRKAGHLGGIVTPAGGGAPLLVDEGGISFSNWQLRRALEEAAWLPSATADYDPVSAGFELADPYLQGIIPLVPGIATPIPPVAPWVNAAWGVITPTQGVIENTLAGLGVIPVAGVPGGALRSKSADHCDFQATLFDLRLVHWNNTGYLTSALFGNDYLPDQNPYLYCTQGLIPR